MAVLFQLQSASPKRLFDEKYFLRKVFAFFFTSGIWEFFHQIFGNERIEQFLKLLSTFSRFFAVFLIFFAFYHLFRALSEKTQKVCRNVFAEISKVQYRVWKIISTVFLCFCENEKTKLSLWGSVRKYNWFLSKYILQICQNCYTCLEEPS